MTPCYAIEIVTPKKYILNGLWFGPYSAKATKGKPKKPKRVIIWVHGLGGSMFGKLKIAKELADRETAVLVFNNRGHDTIANVSTTGGKRVKAGAAYERFTDSADDVQGAINFVRRQGVKRTFVAGHSTGSQKSIYWASKKGKGVLGIVLLAPMSDYSAERIQYGARSTSVKVAYARKMLKQKRSNELLPGNISRQAWSAQRYLSLFSGESAEEIFPYWDRERNPRTLRSVRLPILTLLAEKDEHADRSAKLIRRWFETHVQNGRVEIIPRVPHSFKGGERKVAALIRNFIKNH